MSKPGLRLWPIALLLVLVAGHFPLGTALGDRLGATPSDSASPAVSTQNFLPIVMRNAFVPGNISGVVTDAVSNPQRPIAGATVCVTTVAPNPCATTDAAGAFALNGVPSGPQTIQASATGYTRIVQNIQVPQNQTLTWNFSLSPTLAAGEIRIVLNWGATPSDLDSHLWLPPAHPNHVKWTAKGNCLADPFACLDVDDRSSYGPETMTIKQRFSGTYVYAVYQWSSSPSIVGCGARVLVYGSSGLVREYQVPSTGSGRWWYVFDLDGASGALTDHNSIVTNAPGSYDANPSSADGSLSDQTGEKPSAD